MKMSLIKQAVTDTYINKRIHGATPKEMAITMSLPLIKLVEQLFNKGKATGPSKFNKKFERVYQAVVKRKQDRAEKALQDYIAGENDIEKYFIPSKEVRNK